MVHLLLPIPYFQAMVIDTVVKEHVLQLLRFAIDELFLKVHNFEVLMGKNNYENYFFFLTRKH